MNQRVWELFEKRYPNLAFLSQIWEKESPFSPFIEDGKTPLPSQKTLEKVDLIYVYGIGLGSPYFVLKQWLEKEKTRNLVFLEEEMEALRHFLTVEGALEILSHPQVHIRFNLDKTRLQDFAFACARDFPSSNVEIAALSSYKKRWKGRFYRLRLVFLRATTVENAIFSEDLHHHMLMKNFFPNYFQLKNAFLANELIGKFAGVPALVCGAGPSLEEEFDHLRNLNYKAVLIAGGSAIPALSQNGVLPHLGVAIDPNFEEYKRFCASVAFETPLLYMNRVYPDIFKTQNGPLGYLCTSLEGKAEAWIEKTLNLPKAAPFRKGFDIEAMSVTTTAIQIACSMGCNPIILVGVDLAFTNGLRYASGVVEDAHVVWEKRKEIKEVSEQLLRRRDEAGNSLYTLVKWVMEGSAISRFATKNRETSFFNASLLGLPIKGIPKRPLSEISFPHSYDLQGEIGAAIESAKLKTTSDEVAAVLKRLEKNIEKAKSYSLKALGELEKGKNPEGGRLTLYTMEFEDLEGYAPFFKPACLALERGYFAPAPFFLKGKEEEMERKRNFLHKKWTACRDLALFYSNLLSNLKEK